jgi:hypothetical protein
MSDDPTKAFLTADPIELGSMLFTLVEPHRGHEVAYNRWYERDHFYAGCLIGPWNFSARRFVCTRELKALRYPKGSPIVPSLEVGSFLAMYWILAGRHEEWTRWGRRQVKVLIDADRMFPHRDHVHTQMYRFEWSVNRDPDGVPAELALDHPFKGLVVVWSEAKDGKDRGDVLEWCRTQGAPRMLAGSASALCLCFTPIPMPSGQPSNVPESSGDEQRFLSLYFLDSEPSEVWEESFAPGEVATDNAEVLLASPFVPTIPGTDAYTDRLW